MQFQVIVWRWIWWKLINIRSTEAWWFVLVSIWSDITAIDGRKITGYGVVEVEIDVINELVNFNRIDHVSVDLN